MNVIVPLEIPVIFYIIIVYIYCICIIIKNHFINCNVKDCNLYNNNPHHYSSINNSLCLDFRFVRMVFLVMVRATSVGLVGF